jgi:hypothetical protein
MIDITTTEEPAGELELYEPRPPTTLFHTSDPDLAVVRMGAIAKTLVDVIEQKHLYAEIRGKRHITIEGWSTLGGMVGVHAIVTDTRVNETGDGIVARAEARTLAGQLVGGAEGECSRSEQRWKTADPFAIRSMAQTRALSRALRGPLGQITVLAGYEPAGAEEMPQEAVSEPEPRSKIPHEQQPTREQLARIGELLVELTKQAPDVDWKARARELAGVPGDMLTATIADSLIDQLRDERDDLELARLSDEAAA